MSQLTLATYADLATYEAFIDHLESLPQSSNTMEVAWEILSSKTKLPWLPDGTVVWIFAFTILLILHLCPSAAVLAYSAYRKELWLFRIQTGIITVNVRVVLTMMFFLQSGPWVASGLSYALAQTGRMSYRWALFLTMHRYVWLWATIWVYLHGILTHLFLSRFGIDVAPWGAHRTRWMVGAINIGAFIFPTVLPIVQTVLSFLCSRALGRAIDLVEDLLQRYQEVSTSWEKGTPLAQYAGLLNQTRPVFTSMSAATKFLRAYELVWAGGVGFLLVVCLLPLLHHLKSLVLLIGFRVRTARIARTTDEASRALWGSTPPQPDSSLSPTLNQPGGAAGVHIRSDSFSLLVMILIMYALALAYLAVVGVSMRYSYSDFALFQVQFVPGNILAIIMGLVLDCLYLWPPLIRHLYEFGQRQDVRWADIPLLPLSKDRDSNTSIAGVARPESSDQSAKPVIGKQLGTRRIRFNDSPQEGASFPSSKKSRAPRVDFAQRRGPVLVSPASLSTEAAFGGPPPSPRAH